MNKKLISSSNDDNEQMLELGSWLGRHQAFGLIANRCTAADAECLKAIRSNGEYKTLGLTWAQFCEQRAGITRRYADKLIGHLEEFGVNYFRLADLIHVSTDTYRLIASSVTDDGLEHNGKKIPLLRENRQQLTAAVEALSADRSPKAAQPVNAPAIYRRLEAVLEQARALESHDRLAFMGRLEQAAREFSPFGQR